MVTSWCAHLEYFSIFFMNSTGVQYWCNFEYHLTLILLNWKSNLEQWWNQWKYSCIKLTLGDNQIQEDWLLEFKEGGISIFSVLFLIWVPSEILSGGFLNHVKQLRPKYFNITISQLQYKLFLLILNTRLVIFDRLFSSTWICQLSSKLPIDMTLMTSPYLCTLFSSGMFISAFHEKMQLTSYPFLVCQFYINSLGFPHLIFDKHRRYFWWLCNRLFLFLVRKGKLLVTTHFGPL